MQKMILSREVSFLAKHDAFEYQRQAFEAVKDLEYSAIFHEQGLGKTKIAIDLLLYWLENKQLDVVLIVTKKQLVPNWISEFKEHTSIIPAVLTDNKRENYFVLNGRSRVIVTNFEIVRTEEDTLKKYLQILNVGIIIDESTKLKNPESKLSKAFFNLREGFKRRVIMTGTPVANRPYDIWSQIFFLDGGESLGKSFKEFKKETDLSNNLYCEEEKAIVFEEEVSHIFSKIKGFSVRETKQSGSIYLPSKNFIKVEASFEEHQLYLYEKIRKDMQVLIEKNEEVLLDVSSATLKRLLRLVQVASNPKLIDDQYCFVSGKENELDALLVDIFDRGEKCIVWSSFVENVNYYTSKYIEKGSVKIHGKMAIEERVRSIEKFKNDPNTRVLFATPQAAKEGLTLTVANNVVFYDRSFSLDDYLQAQDRIHRISQTKECNIYNIVLQNSIDEWVDVLLKAKENAAKLGQGDIEIEQYRDNMDYSFGEIIKEILGSEEPDDK